MYCAGNPGIHAGEAERIVRSTISSCVWFALLLVTISVTALHPRAVPVRDTLNHTLSGLDVEASRGPNGNPALVQARFR